MRNRKNTLMPEVYSDLLQGQVRYLYQHSSLNFWGNLILSSLITLAFFNTVISSALLIAWFLTLSVVIFLRLMKNSQFDPKQKYSHAELESWLNWYIVFTLTISLIWGLSAVMIFPEGMIYQALLILALSTILLTSIPTLTASRKVFYLQIGLLLLPMLITLLSMVTMEYMLLAFVLLLMSLTVAVASHYVHDLLLQLHETKELAQAQAHTDQLTRLANRRHFDTYFKMEWRRAAREQQPLSLMMIDVDYFKNYNDDNGHQEGDRCLKKLASTMKTVARRSADLASRHGGEEFAILLPNTHLDDAKALAETLREKIMQLGIPHHSSQVADVVTVSIGVSGCIPLLQRNHNTGSDVTYPAMLLRSADRSMYMAKERGRNRVEHERCGESSTSWLNAEIAEFERKQKENAVAV
jgi:diguanylate cyclase (GGDEF)-like protein